MSTSQQGKIVVSFLRTGLLGFAGGPSMTPLVHQEVVKRHGWLHRLAHWRPAGCIGTAAIASLRFTHPAFVVLGALSYGGVMLG
ncbi:chromate transporter [Billgrantia endophytica]|uniref:chromate transporter n=1 Tax=Billgrantia endophytica TaxID=2033802 RepID=UPI000D525E12|nr:chromate transporter [Halomonas endophytica]